MAPIAKELWHSAHLLQTKARKSANWRPEETQGTIRYRRELLAERLRLQRLLQIARH